MSISVTFNSAHRILLASDFFMARRPVLDREQHLVAHELMFFSDDRPAPDVSDTAEQPASTTVIGDVYQHGMGRVIGDLMGILYVDPQTIMSNVFDFLPPEKLVLEIAEVHEVTPALLERLAELNQKGFHFALVDNGGAVDLSGLLPFVEGVRIDVTGKSESDLARLCAAYAPLGKQLLAEKVDTHEQFQTCHKLGFDYFQGYYFTLPVFAEGRKLAPSNLAITSVLALIVSDADNSVIEDRIKGNVSLGLNLLRLANTPAFSTHRIDSLRQALMVLGRNQLQRWLQVMLYADNGAHGGISMPLLDLATTRGRLMELLAQKLKPGNRGIADTSFTVGIMSLMDSLFGMPMEKILEQIPVVEEVSDALLHRQGYYGQLLRLVEYTEWHAKVDAPLLQAIGELRLTHNDIYLLQLAAFEWSDHVTRSMR
ncbi:EAL and HDOD domain-containing protein [Noviherbaspirillum sp. ST9]|uniref:EAL and HDOD domain-containing protein n=1 Tax=Noviherbaspirillum sp. ST9 TaxID=3401606 RepID=UPI003B587C33